MPRPGRLGGLLLSTVKTPEPARARFIPPRETAFDFTLKDQNAGSLANDIRVLRDERWTRGRALR